MQYMFPKTTNEVDVNLSIGVSFTIATPIGGVTLGVNISKNGVAVFKGYAEGVSYGWSVDLARASTKNQLSKEASLSVCWYGCLAIPVENGKFGVPSSVSLGGGPKYGLWAQQNNWSKCIAFCGKPK